MFKLATVRQKFRKVFIQNTATCGKGSSERHVQCLRDGVEVEIEECKKTLWKYENQLELREMAPEDLHQTRECFDAVCPEQPYWTEWTECDVECRQHINEAHYQRRRKVCPPGAVECEEVFEKKACALKYCPDDTKAEW